MELQTAIYTTLLHSLWMGLILATLTSAIIISTRRQTASLRYNLLTASLIIFVLSIGFVFYKNLNTDVVTNHVYQQQSGFNVPETHNSMIGTSMPTAVNDSFLDHAKSFVSLWSSYSNQIVLIWFLIICAKSIQLFLGLQSIRYIKSTKVFSAGAFWEQKVAELSKKLNISKPVKILQSGLAKVPMIVGHFKPVILIPLGLINGLAVNEVEAIISHELAHLKRNDYLINLIQSFVEIVFFFNPAVLWISKLIKEERENCCDDLALSCIESKHQYIKALISCQEFSSSYPNYAMAIIGKKSTLKDRVSRMVFGNNSSLNKVEKTLLSVALVSALLLTTAFTKVRSYVKENRSSIAENIKVAIENTAIDTIKSKPSSLRKSNSAAPDPRITRIKASQQKIDKKIEASTNDKITKARERNYRVYLANVNAYKANIKKYQEDVKKYQSDVKRQQNQIQAYQGKIARYQKDVMKYQSDVARYAADPINNVVPIAPTVPVIAPTPVAPNVPKTPIQPLAVTIHSASKNINFLNVNRPVKINVPIMANTGKPQVESRDDKMTTELKKDGLLKDVKNFEYTLTPESMIINGVKQPESVHRKYLKYLKNETGTVTTKVSTT